MDVEVGLEVVSERMQYQNKADSNLFCPGESFFDDLRGGVQKKFLQRRIIYGIGKYKILS